MFSHNDDMFIQATLVLPLMLAQETLSSDKIKVSLRCLILIVYIPYGTFCKN